jgi:hypothetical protein
MEAVSTSETSVSMYQITRYSISEDSHIQDESVGRPLKSHCNKSYRCMENTVNGISLAVPVAVKRCNFTESMYCIRRCYLLELSTPQRETTVRACGYYHEIAMLNACFSTQGVAWLLFSVGAGVVQHYQGSMNVCHAGLVV